MIFGRDVFFVDFTCARYDNHNREEKDEFDGFHIKSVVDIQQLNYIKNLHFHLGNKGILVF